MLWGLLSLHLLGADPGERADPPARSVKVEVVKTDDGFQLLRGGKPYFIKGAGAISHYHLVRAYGGNSIRTWSTQQAQAVLDSAQRHGLTVMLGLPVVPERHGFNYDDERAVKQQLEKIKREVLKYKDHPALLAWAIGNELNLAYQNPKVWHAVEDIAKMIHKVDSNHLVTTVLAGVNPKDIGFIKSAAPSIDVLSINTYAGLQTLPETLKASGWDDAYIVTEWGPTGHWEALQTAWHAPVEETSCEKAAVYKQRYTHSIEWDKAHCLGSYVFLWGQKQERTPTWYGIFTAEGQPTHVADVMQYLWTGTFPDNKAPQIYGFVLDGRKAHHHVRLEAGARYEALVTASDPEQGPLTYRWEILPEATQVGEGGDPEEKPRPIKMSYSDDGMGKIMLSAPDEGGAYRLFVYISDDKNKVATANIPFFVMKADQKNQVTLKNTRP